MPLHDSQVLASYFNRAIERFNGALIRFKPFVELDHNVVGRTFTARYHSFARKSITRD
jgi:hypothetical protein